jgi:uncharacterized circularly permuted ATP-grasp superfamily protein/uncharacterized alpha-E superfamily protein
MDDLFPAGGYRAGPMGYDEMLDSSLEVRPHWQALMHTLGHFGPEALNRHRQEMLKLLRENGVSYNIYGTPDGQHRAWQLDPVPLLIAHDEWADIEAGLVQRAQLLDRILADLYGPRELIRKGLLPLELIYGHRGFLRPCDQIKLPGKHPLVLYAADLARGADGRMRVIGDRTQAPSGMGYALENRAILSRVMPDLFQGARVHFLEDFFQQMRDGLQTLASPANDAPHVVVMTPGPLNETFFEHAYLAAYLGYPLVQGDDLVVRDGCVWLKALSGLQKVDVILRRVDEDYCDPLELREDSRLGVPGLLEAVRRGNVAIANPLGSGVLENPALLAFLPGIAQHFGETLALPSVATWWCGQKRECDYVLANLATLVIKPIHRSGGMRPVFGSQLDREELASWRERIQAQPALYVGQEEMRSTVPVLVGKTLEPRRSVLRSFLVARGDSYAVMPGGLTRCAPGSKDRLVTSQAGGNAKDTWILAASPLTPPLTAYWAEPPAGAHDAILPSRAADNLYWAGRYAERSEGTARLLRTAIKELYDHPGRVLPVYVSGMECLLRALTGLTGTYPGFLADIPPAPEPELRALVFDATRSGSLAHTLRCQLQASYAVRELWSSDTWRVMDELEEQWLAANRASDPDLWRAMDFMDQLLLSLSAFGGMATESMTRGKGWLFLNIGRRLERAVLLVSLLRSAFAQQHPAAVEDYLIDAILGSSDHLVRDNGKPASRPTLAALIQLLALDRSNPRSLLFQAERLQEYIADLPADRNNESLALAHQMVEELRHADPAGLLAASPQGNRTQLEALMGRFSAAAYCLSDALTSAYFRHEPSHPLSQAQAV